VIVGSIAVVVLIAIGIAAIARILRRDEDDPAWWPEFERQFEDHVAGRGRLRG
jgi:hypothetical protein